MSPSSDFAVMITLFYIIIVWLDLLEQKEASTVPYSLLCVAGGLYGDAEIDGGADPDPAD